MAIRLPLKAVLDYNNQVEQGGGPASVAGGVAKTFTIPQDADNIVVKYQTSMVGGGASVTLRTTDDGGITWYDVSRSSIVSNTGGSVVGGGNINAIFLAAGVNGDTSTNIVASLVATGSVITANTAGGSAAASSLGVGQSSGLPILSQQGRVFIRYGSAITSIMNERVTVLVNSQSATA